MTLQNIHSLFAYAVLALLIIAVANAVLGLTSKRNFTETDRKISLIAFILSHIQLLIGLVLWFTSPLGKAAFGQMSNTALRLTSLEHPLTNIIAIAFITIGFSKHKKEESSNGKFKKIAIFFGLGLLLILSRIPWRQWFS